MFERVRILTRHDDLFAGLECQAQSAVELGAERADHLHLHETGFADAQESAGRKQLLEFIEAQLRFMACRLRIDKGFAVNRFRVDDFGSIEEGCFAAVCHGDFLFQQMQCREDLLELRCELGAAYEDFGIFICAVDLH